MSRITPERAAAMLLDGPLDDIWRHAVELDHADPAPVPVLRWLRHHDLAEYRPPDRDVHPVGEWAASDAGLALGDSFRDGERSREEVVAVLAQIANGEPAETSHYEAIAWERRANGARMFVATRRHYRRVPGPPRTLCGVSIPQQILNPSPRRWPGPLSLSAMSAGEIAAEPACTRCAAAGGGE